MSDPDRQEREAPKSDSLLRDVLTHVERARSAAQRTESATVIRENLRFADELLRAALAAREEPPKDQMQVVVDFLDAWRFCPVARSFNPPRSCLEDAAAQLLDALAAREEPSRADVNFYVKAGTVCLFGPNLAAKPLPEGMLVVPERELRPAREDTGRPDEEYMDASERYARAAEYIDASIETGGSRPSPSERERAIEKVLKATAPYLVRDTEQKPK